MGVGVSNWCLARAVSLRGQLGVVSGTGIELAVVRRLQDGDIGGHIRRAMEAFPIRSVTSDVLRRYFRPEGRPEGTPYKLIPMYKQVVSAARQQLSVISGFVEVYLAKEGHDGLVGMNLLTKIPLPNLPTLYGAMLAGVDCILMGAGIPRDIPGSLDRMAEHQPAAIQFEVEGLRDGSAEYVRFDPQEHWDETPPRIARPKFYPIVASNSLATFMARKATGTIEGLIVEGPTAGGHNAPPRGEQRLNHRGEPIYGARDVVDLGKIRDLGFPFWVAGSAGRPERLAEVQAVGATGIQVGTLFAYCDESGIAEDIKRSVLSHAARGEVDVRTDPRASPTGYPIKVVDWPADPAIGVPRQRICDLGYLRTAYMTPKKKIGFRCPSEPIEDYVKKGGNREDTQGRRCLCNSLIATIGHPQVRDDIGVEPPVVTSGDELENIGKFLAGRTRYTADDVLDYLLSQQPVPAVESPLAVEAPALRNNGRNGPAGDRLVRDGRHAGALRSGGPAGGNRE